MKNAHRSLRGSAAIAALALPFAAQDAKPDEEPPERPFANLMSPAESDPDVPRGVIVNEEAAFAGYTLFEPLNSHSIYLIDMDGTVVHEWLTETAPGAFVYLQDDGTLLRGARDDTNPRFNGGGIGGSIQRLAPDGKVLWSWKLAEEDRHLHHDLEPLPNGNLLVIHWERIPEDEAVYFGRDAGQVGRVGLWPDAVLEIQPVPPDGAKVVWEWHAWDHLVQDANPEGPNFGSVADQPGRIDVNADHRDRPPLTADEIAEMEAMEDQLAALGYAGGGSSDGEEDERRHRSGDWLHTNSVAYEPEYDLIALSSPEMCELWVIDHSTTRVEAASSSGGRWGRGGDLLWRWGNPRNYGAGDEGDQRLFYQHDPKWIRGPEGDLRLLVFNNGGERPEGRYSSVEELVLPFDPERGFHRGRGRPFGPETPAWTYSDPETFFSAFISGSQRLPNGNTLICSGVAGRLFEVTAGGEVVWDFRNPYGGEITPPDHAGHAPPRALFRGTRLGREHPGVRALLR